MFSRSVVYHIIRLSKTLSDTVRLLIVDHCENTLVCDIAFDPKLENIVSRILFSYCVRDLSRIYDQFGSCLIQFCVVLKLRFCRILKLIYCATSNSFMREVSPLVESYFLILRTYPEIQPEIWKPIFLWDSYLRENSTGSLISSI